MQSMILLQVNYFCLSVARWYCICTKGPIVTQSTLYGNQEPRFMTQNIMVNSNGVTNEH